MDQLLQRSEGSLWREPSGAFFAPLRSRSTCSGDMATDTSSTSFEEMEAHQGNSRRITQCKQVLQEATIRFNAAPIGMESQLLKSAACRNSGALLPLLKMLAAEQDPARLVRYLETLSFLLMDHANRRACHELRALDVLLDMLRRATDHQVVVSILEALSSLCKHDAKDKMALWQHPKKGALLSMLSSCHNSGIIVEALRTCRILCFIVRTCSSNPTPASSTPVCASACCLNTDAQHSRGGDLQQYLRTGQASSRASSTASTSGNGSHQALGGLQLIEPALLTVSAELLHPSTDAHVLHKALRLLHIASANVICATQTPGCCGCWHNAVFRIVPLLTHCADVDVVESALAVLVNLSEHDMFHNMFFASGCIPPLLHLLNHKRCTVSQCASCILSALAEGGLSRDKLCQDTALLAMLRVLQANHCVVVTLGVLYMLGRLAAYRSQVVRSLRGWGAIPLLTRLLASTQDEDAAAGCRDLLQLLGVNPPAATAQATAIAAARMQSHAVSGPADGRTGSLHAAHSSSSILESVSNTAVKMMLSTGAAPPAVGQLCRTISAAATVTVPSVPCSVGRSPLGASAAATPTRQQNSSQSSVAKKAVMEVEDRRSPVMEVLRSKTQHTFRFLGPSGVAACGPMGSIATAVPPAAAY